MPHKHNWPFLAVDASLSKQVMKQAGMKTQCFSGRQWPFFTDLKIWLCGARDCKLTMLASVIELSLSKQAITQSGKHANSLLFRLKCYNSYYKLCINFFFFYFLFYIYIYIYILYVCIYILFLSRLFDCFKLGISGRMRRQEHDKLTIYMSRNTYAIRPPF